jgi:Protein of unknown function (DUF3800)
MSRSKLADVRKSARHFLSTFSGEDADDIRLVLEYLLRNCVGMQNAITIPEILRKLKLSKKCNKSSTFQHRVLIPLKNQSGFFAASYKEGIFIPIDPADFLCALDFYNRRISSERRHLGNLKRLSTRLDVFQNFNLTNKQQKRFKKYDIFFDESGTPSINDLVQPTFIVSAVIFDASNKSVKQLASKIGYIRQTVLQWNDPDKEFKSENLKSNQWLQVLRELCTLDFEVFSIAFDKQKLHQSPIATPTGIYRAAFKLLVNRVLDHTGLASLYFDDYSNMNSKFISEFEAYIRAHAKHYPLQKIERLSAVRSKEDPGVQLADIVCGAIKRGVLGNQTKIIRALDDKLVEFEKFP